MSGETDLSRMLETLEVDIRPGTFAFVSAGKPDLALDSAAAARIVENEGVTYVVPAEVARAHGADIAFEAAWLTLRIHSALQAVGLTAAVSRALSAHGIACNVLAAFHHDHLLVPADRADDALVALRALRND